MTNIFLDKILRFARSCENIAIVGMEGSRTNDKIQKDSLQDYDISFLVRDFWGFFRELDSAMAKNFTLAQRKYGVESRLQDSSCADCSKIDFANARFTQPNLAQSWLNIFGEVLFMQTPEAMSAFAPDLNGWCSYLVLFADGVRLDLTIIPLSDLQSYLKWDSLLKILLDKDNLTANIPAPSDKNYHIKDLEESYFWDYCNEFWFAYTCVNKALLRGELVFAKWHIDEILLPMLFNILGFKVAKKRGCKTNLGKKYRFLEHYLNPRLKAKIHKTFNLKSLKSCKKATKSLAKLFIKHSKKVSKIYGFAYPNYEKNIKRYLEAQEILYKF